MAEPVRLPQTSILLCHRIKTVSDPDSTLPLGVEDRLPVIAALDHVQRLALDKVTSKEDPKSRPLDPQELRL